MDDFAMLRLQIEWGADDALDTDPVDRLRVIARPIAQATTTQAANAQAANASAQAEQPQPVAEPIRLSPAERAIAAAAQAHTLDALRTAIATFDGCALRDTAGNLVFAEGDPDAGLLVIGEAPGADEDRTGHVFAGREGAFLDKMLASIGLTRDHMLLAPLVPWRPPGGRAPHLGEVTVCLPFLHRLIVLTRPTRLVLLGTQTAANFLPATARRRSMPVWIDCTVPGRPDPLPALAMPGLSILLKNPPDRRNAWAGLRLLRRDLDQA